jgi:hypothetical protein
MPLINLIKNVISIVFYTHIVAIFTVGTIVIIQEFNLGYYLEHCKNRLRDAIENMNTIVWPSIFDDIGDSVYFVSEEEIEDDIKIDIKEKKYEEKYLDDVRNMSSDITLNDTELEMLNIHKREFYRAITDRYINNISDLKNKIDDLKLEISVFKEYDVTEDKKNSAVNETTSSSVKNFEKDINKYNDEIILLERKLNNKSEIENEASEEAKKIIMNDRHEKLINSFVIEKTPLGNVLMFYNNKRGSFEYYSDNTIPYRYLEVVGRKYVKMFHCRSLYFDMEEELRKYEEKLEKMQRLEEEEKKNKSSSQNSTTSNLVNDKKNVFAKFKSYNKEAGTGHVMAGAPPKNNIVNSQTMSVKNDKLVLKENANRYTHEGKLSNFSFLKKIPRKVVDKKYALTFAEFKKMNGRL